MLEEEVPPNEDGIQHIVEENIVSNKVGITDEREEEDEELSTQATENEITVVADIDNEIETDPLTVRNRPRRSNA